MSTENILLLEIGTEELPPKDLQNLSLSLAEIFAKELTASQLTYREIINFASPRRLALQIFGLPHAQPARSNLRKGPSLKDAFDANGQPTKAALGFAQSCGVEVGQLSQQDTPKGKALMFTEHTEGQATTKIIAEILTTSIAALPIAKRMRWGSLQQSFVRPVHWLVLLFNDTVVDAQIFGIQADRLTYGHRYHHPQAISLAEASLYPAILEQRGMLIPSFTKRLEMVTTAAKQTAAAAGGALACDPALLELITGIVEYPQPLLASFNPEYLAIPQEALIAAMQEHQKCLPVVDSAGKLMAKFVIISNIKSTDPASVIYGNQLVMHARLADAAFLFNTDQKHKLADNLAKLTTITFQAKLGTVFAKTERIGKLALVIAAQLGADASHTAKAAQLCKADLCAQMVAEFPELQGVMGSYYARQDGEADEVACAIREHYLPKFSQDVLPTSKAGMCLALADRIDTLVGLFAINKIPTGDKDPFALKRQALAVLRIIIEHQLDLNLAQLCATAYANYAVTLNNSASLELLQDFFYERLRSWYLAGNGNPKVFAAVLAKRPACLFEFYQRLQAVQQFLILPEAESLAAANKRVKNILAQVPDFIAATTIAATLLTEQSEQALNAAIEQHEQQLAPMLAAAKFNDVLQLLAALREPIDLFFQDVMVMTDNLAVRDNRLSLLSKLRALFLQVADISLL